MQLLLLHNPSTVAIHETVYSKSYFNHYFHIKIIYINSIFYYANVLLYTSKCTRLHKKHIFRGEYVFTIQNFASPGLQLMSLTFKSSLSSFKLGTHTCRSGFLQLGLNCWQIIPFLRRELGHSL